MNWNNRSGLYGEYLEELADLVAHEMRNGNGAIEIRMRPYNWERLVRELGSNRSVSLESCEGRSVAVSASMGRVVRLYSSEQMPEGVDYQSRVKP